MTFYPQRDGWSNLDSDRFRLLTHTHTHRNKYIFFPNLSCCFYIYLYTHKSLTKSFIFNDIICASSRLRSVNSHNWHSARDNYPYRHWGLHKHDKIQDHEGLKPKSITILITAQAESLCCTHTVTGSASCPHCCFLILRSINHPEVDCVCGKSKEG